MVHEMKLQAVYFEKMRAGQKIYEGRLFDDKRKKIAVGDEIIFKKEPELAESLKTKVLDMVVFDSFDKMAGTLPARELGFEGKSKDEIVKTYHSFYSEEDEKKYKVVAIKVERK